MPVTFSEMPGKFTTHKLTFSRKMLTLAFFNLGQRSNAFRRQGLEEQNKFKIAKFSDDFLAEVTSFHSEIIIEFTKKYLKDYWPFLF